MIGVRFPRGIPAGVPQRLEEARVFVSVRGDAIRVAPHVYNGEEDVARFSSVLREFL
jgi:selenocysteine lyase/cysteine desulfurase